MNFNVLIGGAAGQGMDTLAAVLEKVLKRNGFYIFTIRDYMSRVRGGHNFIQVRFGGEELTSHWDVLDGMIALDEDTTALHRGRLKKGGFIVGDESFACEDERFLMLPLKEAAKELGNPRVFGSVALGAVVKLFGLKLAGVREVLREVFEKPGLDEQNYCAVEMGYKMVEERYKAEPASNRENLLIDGNSAIGLGALAAGCTFYSAYPMTPSTSIMDYLAARMEKAGIVVEQAEDEIAAVNMAIGASYAGARAMTGTSGGGFALMAEALGLSGMMEIPLVIAEIQRPGPTTGFPTRTEQADLRFVISASQGEFPRMVIALKNPEDAFYQTVRAFNIADKYQIPVILLGDQFLADYTTTVNPFDIEQVEINRHLCNEQDNNSIVYQRYRITGTGISPRIIPCKVPGKIVLADSDEHDEYGHITESAEVRVQMNNKRLRKLETLKGELQEPEFLGGEACDTLLVAWGSLHGPVAEAIKLLNKEGGNYGALIFGDIWPFPEKRLQEKAKKAKRIIHVEQNATGQLASIIREMTGIRCDEGILKYDGRPMSSQYIYESIKGRTVQGKDLENKGESI